MKHLIEPEKKKKFGIAMCDDEVQLWAEAYLRSFVQNSSYDKGGKVFISLPQCIQGAIIEAAKTLATITRN